MIKNVTLEDFGEKKRLQRQEMLITFLILNKEVFDSSPRVFKLIISKKSWVGK